MRLLEESPITSPSVVQDVRESVFVGEIGLAFETLCSWIYEDDLPISAEYYARLAAISEEMGGEEIVAKLRELIVD